MVLSRVALTNQRHPSWVRRCSRSRGRGRLAAPGLAALRGEPARANLECEILSVGRTGVRSGVIASPDETLRAAAERVVNAYVLDFLTAEHGVAGRLPEESRP